MTASVSKSSTLIACTDECLSRRVEGKALGFDVEVTTFAEVSGVSVPQSSQRTSVSAFVAPMDLGRRFPQASQKRSEPIATIMEAGAESQGQFKSKVPEMAGIVEKKDKLFKFRSVLLTKKSNGKSASVSLSAMTCLLDSASFKVDLCLPGWDLKG